MTGKDPEDLNGSPRDLQDESNSFEKLGFKLQNLKWPSPGYYSFASYTIRTNESGIRLKYTIVTYKQFLRKEVNINKKTDLLGNRKSQRLKIYTK